MRAGHNNGWLIEEDKLLGINLGSDFCAEHEWYIKKLNEVLGIKDDESVFGIERRRVNYDAECVMFTLSENQAGLAIMHPWRLKHLKHLKEWSRELQLNEDLATAWDNSSLGIRVTGEKYIGYLQKLYEALKANDAAIWLGGDKFLKNAGLHIGIISNIPAHYLQAMYDTDVDHHNLTKASEAIGIKENR